MDSQEFQEKRLEYQLKIMEYHEKQLRRKAIFRVLIGAVLGGVVLFMIWRLFDSTIPLENKDVIYLLVGNATGAFFGTMINFYFGDSEGRIEAPTDIVHQNTVPENSGTDSIMRGK